MRYFGFRYNIQNHLEHLALISLLTIPCLDLPCLDLTGSQCSDIRCEDGLGKGPDFTQRDYHLEDEASVNLIV